ncbi:sarcosine oxidase-like protein [Lineolata rhizophorae]|uniref:Sarcosine oxidase-like protein n=1 Tax=Lineolata rhizophorae TaxID=578093 RepID=A0A6A6P4Y0_9PEZI|nr:sarcosine oxidase-like protein [Lineolata rhizophorae]
MVAASASAKASYLIVGSGVFGASTAYHLITRYPDASITLNKVVRADYGDIFYMRLGLAALDAWRNDLLLSPFYHQCIPVAKAKELFGGLYANANYEGIEDAFVNRSGGLAAATSSIQAIVGAAIQSGVKFVKGNVDVLLLGKLGCEGVRLNTEEVLKAGRTIVCTGAGTPKLLVDSAPENDSIHIGDRMCVAGVATGMVKLNDEQMNKFGRAPVFVNHTGETLGETMPPIPDNLLKFCRVASFKNTIGKMSGEFSMPPDEPEYGQWKAPPTLRDEIVTVQKGIYGGYADSIPVDQYRLCWDAITPNQDFIISPHPRVSNLYMATGGLFHAWKFLPVIGEYVVSMLEGTLDDETSRRWAWDREGKGGAHAARLPKRELRDL